MARILVGLQEGTAVAEPRGELADLYVRHVPAANRLAFLEVARQVRGRRMQDHERRT